MMQNLRFRPARDQSGLLTYARLGGFGSRSLRRGVFRAKLGLGLLSIVLLGVSVVSAPATTATREVRQ